MAVGDGIWMSLPRGMTDFFIFMSSSVIIHKGRHYLTVSYKVVPSFLFRKNLILIIDMLMFITRLWFVNTGLNAIFADTVIY